MTRFRSSTHRMTCTREALHQRLATRCAPPIIPLRQVLRTPTGFAFFVAGHPVYAVEVVDNAASDAEPSLQLITTSSRALLNLILMVVPPGLIGLLAFGIGTFAAQQAPLAPIPAYIPVAFALAVLLLLLGLVVASLDHWKVNTLYALGARPDWSGPRRAVRDDSRNPWDELSAAHFLSYEARGSTRQLTGSVHGLVVRVTGRQSPSDEQGSMHTEVRVKVPNLPRGLQLRQGTGGTPLGDPILDGQVCVSGDPETILAWARLPAMDALRGVLLEQLHRWPELRLENGQVVYAVPHALGFRLVQCVEDLVALGHAVNALALSARPKA